MDAIDKKILELLQKNGVYAQMYYSQFDTVA